jgi:hypothetical protein
MPDQRNDLLSGGRARTHCGYLGEHDMDDQCVGCGACGTCNPDHCPGFDGFCTDERSRAWLGLEADA